MNFHFIISSLATLTFLAVRVHATYTAEQLQCALESFATFYEQINGILQENGKNPVTYLSQVTSGENFDNWTTQTLNNLKTALKKIPSQKRPSYKGTVSDAKGVLYNALVNCNLSIFYTSTKELIESIEESLVNAEPSMSKDSSSNLHRIFSHAQAHEDNE